MVAGAVPDRVALLINQRAGAARRVDADRLVRLFRASGIEVGDVCEPDSAREMAESAARCAEATPALVIVGGDGAVNAALPGCVGRDVAVGTLPMGTVNVWAREIGMPLRAERAILALARGSVRAIDVGRITWPSSGAAGYFLLMAGLGFDGEVTRLVNPEVKRFLGRGAYALAAMMAYFTHEPYEASIDVDGARRRLELTQLIVANCRRYGGDLPLMASAEPYDGLLDLWTLGPAPRLHHAVRFLRIVVTGSDPGDRLLPARAKSVRVSADHPIAVQLDGDPQAPQSGPIELSVLPGSLRAWFPDPSPAPANVPWHIRRTT